MRLLLIFPRGSRKDWVEEALTEYAAKINHLVSFELLALRTPVAKRENAAAKIAKEEQQILKVIDSKDWVGLFDEHGKCFSNSHAFSEALTRAIHSGKQRVVFVIGGPYGFGEQLKARADQLVSLSPLTMNHFIAQIVACEQIYRALTIWKGLPYHNE